MYEQWHPLGIVAVITAFNFPVAVWAWNAFIAAICGNTVIWKPSSKVPLCAVAVQHICNEVMARHGYSGIFSLFITDDNKVAERLAADERINLLSLTGSTAVGKYLGEKVANRLGKSLLELGGNNAIIVDETADLNLALPAILFGAVGTAGQRCTTTRRLIINKNIYADLIARLINAYQQIRIGDPLEQHNLMGPLVDQSAVDAYAKAITAKQSLN
jgi:aldehyde dehydrogenase (NAD+)